MLLLLLVTLPPRVMALPPSVKAAAPLANVMLLAVKLEMLLFGDRIFYTDWWNSTTFNMYYRKWNILVQDWLYNYIYKDIFELLGRRKVYANFGVIFISGIVHEYILSFVFGFFYPVVFFLFAGLGCKYIFFDRIQEVGKQKFKIDKSE